LARLNFGRLLTAMVTPMTQTGVIDFLEAGKLAERLVATGSDGIVVSGTTGESPTLSVEEKEKLFQVVVEAVGGKAAVIAGTGSYDTKASIQLTKIAQRVGADGLLVVAPYYNKPPQEGLYQHFRAIAESTSLPILLYNIPSRTNVNIEAQTMVRLAKIDNIVGVKEASGNLNQVGTIRSLCPEDFLIYSGDDSLILPTMSLGGVGVISVAAHLVGRRMKEMIEAFADGKVREAEEINSELMPLFRALFLTTNPIPVKAALNIIGQKVGGVRLPLVKATEEETKQVRTVLEQIGMLN
jgi:4-hydroxy-tetrahydrodipicolinate synthase